MMNTEFQEKYGSLSQKDVILHLLQVAQHTATREDVKQDINKLDARIDLLASKLDRFQWLMITGIVALFFKDYIMALFQ